MPAPPAVSFLSLSVREILSFSVLSSSSSLSHSLSPAKRRLSPKKLKKKKIESLRQNKTNRERGGGKRACYLNYAQKTQKPRLKKEKKTVFILSLTCLVQTVFGEIRILLLLLIACANTVADGFCRPPPTPTPLFRLRLMYVYVCTRIAAGIREKQTLCMYICGDTQRAPTVCVWGGGGGGNKKFL